MSSGWDVSDTGSQGGPSKNKAPRDSFIKEPWRPLSGPQTLALASKADILFYGGAAGGGKTDLLLGAAHTQHWRSIIFRRQFTQLPAIIDRITALRHPKDKFSRTALLWQMENGRQVELGAVQFSGDERKYQGRAHDLKAFDELAHFTELQFRTLCGWLRSSNAEQRCRVLAAGNPPTEVEGEWVIRFFAPWLDRTHPNPAQPGELRWFTMLDGHETEVDSGDAFLHKGERITPKSRTFIPAKVEDNPYYMESGYKATLQALPEPLRSKMLYGDFSAGREDNPYQVIPTDWVERAIARAEHATKPAGLTAIGVDVARGGTDRTVLTLRFGSWFEKPRVYSGSSTPSGDSVAQLVLAARGSESCKVQVDVIGVGASVYDCLKRHIGSNAIAMNAAEASESHDKSGQLAFYNRRAEWWWKLREALDPESGAGLMLPNDRELLADLVAPRFRLTARGILVESKDNIRHRLGRSPDKGDSFVLAHATHLLPGSGFINYYNSLSQE